VRLNALKHGLTAETAVLPGEDPEAFERHRDGILAALKPGDDVELALARTFVLATWKTLLCERAKTGLTAHRMHHAELDAAKEEQHRVIDLGRRLFTDQRGDMTDYPHDALEIHYDKRTSAPGAPEDPFDPEHILIELESTIAGCNWLLARWAEQYASKAAGRFLFDPSDEGERLRRHQRACTRDTFRSISQFNLHRESQSLLARPERGSLPVDSERRATGDEEILQNGANAGCNDEAASAGHAGESAAPAVQDPARFKAAARPCSAGEPPPPCDETLSPQPSESSHNSIFCRPPSALPLPRTDGTWPSLLSPSRMAKAAAALSKRREEDRLRRRAARRDNRRWRAERLERKRMCEQAKLEAGAGPAQHAAAADQTCNPRPG
jgi:hypothetical protein